MPANIESMMYVGRAPWHGLGVALPTEVRSHDAMRLAGLDWQVALQPIFSGSNLAQISDHKATVRMSDQKPLGVVGERYTPVQNQDAFSFFDEVVGAGQAIYTTAGALDGGKRIWMLAKLPGEVRVGRDDVTEKYLLLMNSHDGTSALRMLYTPVRVVCQNTLNLALKQGHGDGIAIRHTASATARIDEARRALGLARNYYDGFATEASRLIAAPYSDRQLADLVSVLFPVPAEGMSTRTQNLRAKVTELFEFGRGHEGIKGTAWAALNAVAEFADHHRSVRAKKGQERQEKQLSSTWLGSAAKLKRTAHAFISEQLAA